MIKKQNLRDVEFKSAPNRTIAELISGTVLGSQSLTLRIVDIVPRSQQELRHPHAHQDFEEAIFVLEGKGKIWVEGEFTDIESGDAILIPAGVIHMTVNATEKPLRLVCFFPVRDGVAKRTRSEETINPRSILGEDERGI